MVTRRAALRGPPRVAARRLAPSGGSFCTSVTMTIFWPVPWCTVTVGAQLGGLGHREIAVGQHRARPGRDPDEYQPWVDAGDVGVIRGEDGMTSFGRGHGHVHVHDVRMGRRANRDADLLGAFGGQL